MSVVAVTVIAPAWRRSIFAVMLFCVPEKPPVMFQVTAPAQVKVLIPDLALRRDLGALPDGVELVDHPDRDVEMMVVSFEIKDRLMDLEVAAPGLKVVQSLSAGVDWLQALIPDGVIVCKAVGVVDWG